MIWELIRDKILVTNHEGQLGLIYVNIKIKKIIIIVLKLGSEVDPKQDSGQGSRGATLVDTRQCVDKSGCFNIFKTRLENRSDTRFESWVGGSTRLTQYFFFSKCNWFFTYVLSQVNMYFFKINTSSIVS